jgi:LCP family protein required for cell wall assembly
MLCRKKWIPLAAVLLVIQAALEGHAVFRIARLNMLPALWLVIGIGAAALLLLLTAVLMFAGIKKGPDKGRRVRRVIAVILSLVLMIGSIFVSALAMDTKKTVGKITNRDVKMSAMIGVYVMKDDDAHTIQDAQTYTFGLMQDFDRANTDQAVKSLEKMFAAPLQISEQESAADCAAALYDGTAQALLINESFTSLVDEIEEYKDFETDTRLLYEIPISSASSDEGASADAALQSSDGANAVSNVTTQPFLVYISGSDTRSELLSTSRSDVNILMAVNPATRQILLLNTPRDYYIPNPAGGGVEDKLTHCGLYGIDCSIEALESLYSTDVNYYVQLNFTGFKALIDGIGGITINSPQDFTSSQTTAYQFKKGLNQVNGDQALAFARERYSFAAGDNQRGQDQMEVIRAVIEKVTSGTTALEHYTEILNSLQNMMMTSVSSSEIESFVKLQLSKPGSWDVKRFAVTGTGGKATTYSMPRQKAYVMYPDQAMVDQAAALLQKVMDGQMISDADVGA